MGEYNRNLATDEACDRWKQYSRMVGTSRPDESACLHCIFHHKDRSCCNLEEVNDTRCNTCVNGGVTCASMVDDVVLVCGFVPLPGNLRQGKDWSEIEYWRLSAEEAKKKPVPAIKGKGRQQRQTGDDDVVEVREKRIRKPPIQM